MGHVQTGASPEEAATARSRLMARLLGPDQPADLAMVVALFAAFVVVDRASRALAGAVGADDLNRVSLVAGAVVERWWAAGALAAGLGALALRAPGRLAARWSELEEGRLLRLLAGALVVLVVWQEACYRYNWLAGRSHWPDRLLVVVLGAATIARPAFAVPFVAVARIVAEQFVAPFDTSAGRNIDDLLLMAVLAIGVVHLVHVVTGRNRTSPVLLVLAAAVAAHFFIPGKGKLAIGWLGHGRIADLPLSSYTAGWLGHTSGGWARFLFGFYRRFRWPVMGATLALELSAPLAVIRPRVLRWWLPGAIVFHLVTFATTGFWFLPWIVLEAALIAILFSRRLAPWVAANATPARGLVAAMAVLGAPVVFHPPGLAWLDSPVSYGYRIEAVGASGQRYQVPARELAPLSHHVAFDRLQLGPRIPATGAYGANVSTSAVAELAALTSIDELRAYELRNGPPTLTDRSEAFLGSWLIYAHQPHRSWPERLNRRLAPPEKFWTSSPAPAYGFQEPLVSLEVRLVRSLHHDGHPDDDRELVLSLAVGPDGKVTATEPAG